MTTSFSTDIRPYFTACYRAHMLFRLDLWAQAAVQDNFEEILDAVQSGRMPRDGCGEGIFDARTREQFTADFQSWKAGGFQP